MRRIASDTTVSYIIERRGRAVQLLARLKAAKKGNERLDSMIEAFMRDEVWETDNGSENPYTRSLTAALGLLDRLAPSWKLSRIDNVIHFHTAVLCLRDDPTTEIKTKKVCRNKGHAVTITIIMAVINDIDWVLEQKKSPQRHFPVDANPVESI